MIDSLKNPYESLPPNAFWRTGVADNSPFSISDLWVPRHTLGKKMKIATAGSCFAQHIGRALAANGYHWFDAEPAPDKVDPAVAKRFNYGIFSFRTGNIYTTAALLQWIKWAFDKETAPSEVWEKDGRFYDPFRPAIEPNGFASAAEMHASREVTLAAIRRVITESHRFVFTLGLTEAWVNADTGINYAMCPGTLAGDFNPDKHLFKNYGFGEILSDLVAALKLMREANPKIKFLLTVSPVPLTATASGQHVLTATTYSKSVLRAVAGEATQRFPFFVDYFPSYEIITAPVFRGMFYEPNMRSVHPDGVAFVMKSFFACLQAAQNPMMPEADSPKTKPPTPASDEDKDDVVCEDLVLDSFAKT
jgi:hypothetical protein